ncbi:MAG: hypothetical protein WCK65_01075 [Rhodospirillaceae bacterium]
MFELEFWHWWVGAAVLGALDMFAQSGLLLRHGVAALVVGLVVFFHPDLIWQLQLLAFVVIAVVAFLAMRRQAKRPTAELDKQTPSRSGLLQARGRDDH